jgi:DnaK suppressor protein
MTDIDTKEYKAEILALRARLRDDLDQMADARLERGRSDPNGELSRMPIHMADIGTDNFEREFTLSLMESKDETLQRLEEALERIEDGTFGVCEGCGGRIPKKRLAAIPYATRCVKCASQLEWR